MPTPMRSTGDPCVADTNEPNLTYKEGHDCQRPDLQQGPRRRLRRDRQLQPVGQHRYLRASAPTYRLPGNVKNAESAI